MIAADLRFVLPWIAAATFGVGLAMISPHLGSVFAGNLCSATDSCGTSNEEALR